TQPILPSKACVACLPRSLKSMRRTLGRFFWIVKETSGAGGAKILPEIVMLLIDLIFSKPPWACAFLLRSSSTVCAESGSETVSNRPSDNSIRTIADMFVENGAIFIMLGLLMSSVGSAGSTTISFDLLGKPSSTRHRNLALPGLPNWLFQLRVTDQP